MPLKQDKVNNADSAFIFLINHIISQNGQIVQVGHIDQGGKNGKECLLVSWSIVA